MGDCVDFGWVVVIMGEDFLVIGDFVCIDVGDVVLVVEVFGDVGDEFGVFDCG